MGGLYQVCITAMAMTITSATGEPAAPEHVGLALRAMAAGILFGTGTTGLLLYVVRGLQTGAAVPSATVTTRGLVPNLILTGWLGGALLAALAAWALMAPIQSSYRRGGFSMVAAFGSMVSALITMPADALFGRTGLVGLGILGLVGGGVLAWDAARRAR